jgi:hypothetical protein
MTSCRVVLAAVLVVSCATLPLAAQVPVAPGGKRPGANTGKMLRPSPTQMPANPSPVTPPGPRVQPPANQPSTTQPSANQPSANQPSPTQGAPAAPRAAVTPQTTVTPQAAAVTPPAVSPSAPATPAAATGTFTAGLGLQPFAGGGDAARLDYARTLARNLDSAAVSLVSLYRGTSGQPMAGATGPSTLSGRERDRWTSCRNLYWDFTTFATGVQSVRDGLPPTSPLYRAAAALDTALNNLEALAECDNVASMISAPDRWVPWAEQYTSAARHFYTDWYTEMREAHEKDRAFAIALNAVLPAGRTIPVPSGLPRTPPYAGAAVR